MKHIWLVLFLLGICISLQSCGDKLIKDPSGLDEVSPHNRRLCAAWMGTSDIPNKVELLANALKFDLDITVRAAAAGSLGRSKDPKAGAPLIEALNDKKPLVRRSACLALAELNSAESERFLQNTLSTDEDAAVRKAAAQALGLLNFPSKEEPGKILRSTSSLGMLVKGTEDKSLSVRLACVSSLASISGQNYGNDFAAWRQWWDRVHPE